MELYFENPRFSTSRRAVGTALLHGGNTWLFPRPPSPLAFIHERRLVDESECVKPYFSVGNSHTVTRSLCYTSDYGEELVFF